jgi:hypothetical protein
MKLNKHEKAAVIGMILGDGYLQKTGEKNARLRLEHGAKQKAYLLWKSMLLQRFFQGKPTMLTRVHPITKRSYDYARHQSSSSPELGKLRKIFYPEGKKSIPQDLEKFLISPLTLAIWHMDDGYYDQKDNDIYLGNVSKREAEVARDAIQKKFSLESSVIDKKIKGFVLYFSPRIAQKFSQLIKKYILPEMAYKIPS